MNTGQSKQWWLAAAILFLTILAYQPVWHAGFVWDDDAHVTENPWVKSVDGLQRVWTRKGGSLQQYYPLTFTVFWAEYHLWKLQPLGYHLVNVLLHAVNAILLWRVLRRLEFRGAWLAAAIFALHPVEVESTAWITELKNLLSGMFSLWAVLAYLRFRPLSTAEPATRGDWRFYPVATLLFVCALLSKTAVCCLPVVVLVLIWWKQDRVTKQDIVTLIPWFAASLAMGLITVRVEHTPENSGVTTLTLSMAERCLLAGRALWFYASKALVPRQFIFVYPRWDINGGAAWQYFFPVAAAAVVIALWFLRRRIGRGPLAGVLCFAAMLAPVLGFCGIYYFRYSYVTDHFQYMASIGLISVAVGAGTTLGERAGPIGRLSGTLVAAIVLVYLGVSTWERAHIYHDLETFWRDTLAKNPNAWIAHNNLGIVLQRSGREAEALEQYKQSLQISLKNAEALYNLGSVFSKEGKDSDAIRQYEQALRVQPDFVLAHNNLGTVLDKAGKFDEAIEHYREALRIRPDYAEARFNLGIALEHTGKLPEAVEQYEQALQYKPDFAGAHLNLGLALARLGRGQEAVPHWEQALRINPDYAEAHNNLANALAQSGRLREAIAHYEQALRIKPGDPTTEDNLAWRLATHPPSEGGDPARAVTLAEHACSVTSSNRFAYLDTLAAAYAGTGRFNEAVPIAKKAIDLARDADQTRAVQEIAARLELYRSGQPYHAP